MTTATAAITTDIIIVHNIVIFIILCNIFIRGSILVTIIITIITVKLNHFHISCLRKYLEFDWKDRVPDTYVFEQAGMTSVPTLLQQAQLRWAGHILRMLDTRLPKRLPFGELSNGKRPRGRPQLRIKDTLTVSLKNFDIDIKAWEGLAHNRSSWRTASLAKW